MTHVYICTTACVRLKKAEYAERLGFKERYFCHQVLMERVVCEVRALAVLPTKELAQQVRIFQNQNEVVFAADIKKSSAVTFCCTGLQSVHVIR